MYTYMYIVYVPNPPIQYTWKREHNNILRGNNNYKRYNFADTKATEHQGPLISCKWFSFCFKIYRSNEFFSTRQYVRYSLSSRWRIKNGLLRYYNMLNSTCVSIWEENKLSLSMRPKVSNCLHSKGTRYAYMHLITWSLKGVPPFVDTILEFKNF